GRAVRVDPLGETGAGGAQPPSLHGIARTIDAHGRLLVDLAGGGRRAVDIGDVRHLRPSGPARPTTGDATGIEQEEHGT
ncbi:MAG TPA: biotin--[acetyl-CoA-carboxylase] ligase, partial [Brachybacterium sp.]|nr:biotin--[acetyl-CoA-carboxylase] ligase [Brachybacterium sp.]